jgi:hypothetical protein
MRKRYFRAWYAASAAAGITVALGLGAVSANASVAIHRSHHDTPMCQAYNANGNCQTWEQYNGGGTLGLRITATGGYVNAPVIMTQRDTSDPMQDFIVTPLGRVTDYWNFGANDIGLNAYDNANYTNDLVVLAEFAPGGVPTDLCVANVNNKLVLRQCNGLRWQAFIAANSDADTAGPGPMAGLTVGGSMGPLSIVVPFESTMLLSCAHVFDNGQHLAMTGSNVDGAQATFKHPTQNNLQFWVPDAPGSVNV